MPNIKSQKKRVLITKKENAINSAKRTRVRNSIKKFDAAVAEKNVELATELLKEAVSLLDRARLDLLDRARLDGVYHANTVSRYVGRLSKKLDALKKAE